MLEPGLQGSLEALHMTTSFQMVDMPDGWVKLALKHPLYRSSTAVSKFCRKQLQTDVVSLVSRILSFSPKLQGLVPIERMLAARLKDIVF